MQAKLIRIIQETDRVCRFFFEPQSGLPFVFEPGQFVTLYFPHLPAYENARSYSIASQPGETFFEICVSLNPAGLATPYLWKMQLGENIEFEGPLGSFTLHPAEGRDMVFICTGTGIAPFRSMIVGLLDKQATDGKIYLISGNRWKKDLLYHKEFQTLADKWSSFEYIPVLSREENWDGTKGYVHGVYQQLFSDGRDAHFYVCGWKEMCTEARHHLKALGYNRKQYFFEQYD